MACNDINSNCADSCDQIDGLFEAASNLVQYRDIIEKWLNGKQNETVQIGGEQAKTLLGLIADIKHLVGVLPDGRTIILDDKEKVLSVMLAEGGGIKVKAEGGLYVDVNDILVLGGGLAMDEDGKIYVDFSQMPTDKFEALLKSIRVPIWLSGNMEWYVNSGTGSDTVTNGRGQSAALPFKTVMACLQHVASNYNLGAHVATINIAAGDYTASNIALPSYQATTGKIVLRGVQGDASQVRLGGVSLDYDRMYDLWDVTCQHTPYNSGINGDVQATSGTLSLYNVRLSADVSYGKGQFYPLFSNGGTLRIWATNNAETKSGITILCKGETIAGWCASQNGGIIIYSADITLDGDLKFANAGVIVSGLSQFVRSRSVLVNPGRDPVVTATGTCTGRRYAVSLNSFCSTYNAGADFFPGTVAGTTTTGGQYY